ncbi:MAG: formimidoylglutamate deiminase [Pseudomonas sp.]
MPVFFAERALLPDDWARDVRIEVDAAGVIVSVEQDASGDGAERVNGPVLPGMPNLHSHAFQRAMAGLGEVAGDPNDSFWTWRDLMYRMVGRITPEQFEAVAKQLYIEMLKAGYTSVAEFHYLHHDQQGTPYANLAEMGLRVSSAAQAAGIGLTLLPVLYTYSGFGQQPANHGQRRFLNDSHAYLQMLEQLKQQLTPLGQAVGICFHSLRATSQEQMVEVLANADKTAPVHIHIAEQMKEVQDSLAWSGQRPTEWLYNHFDVDSRWCLVHATHVNPDEVKAIANSQAVAGLCLTTEANLGDGIFPAVDFLAQAGRFGIGSDSHVSVSVVEELRWLEYGQRLRDQRRNRLCSEQQTNNGLRLYNAALDGGHSALGQAVGRIAPGYQADLIVLDGNDPYIQTADAASILNRWIFAGGSHQVRHVMVGGKWVVKDGIHPEEQSASMQFAQTLKVILA